MQRAVRALLLVGLIATVAAAEEATGKVAGTATDPVGTPLTQGAIRLVDVISGKDQAATDLRAGGSYVFDGVPAGLYSVTGQPEGYRLLVSRSVTVKAGETVALDLVFQPGFWSISHLYTPMTAFWAFVIPLFATLWGPRLLAHYQRAKLALDIKAEPPYSHWIHPQFPAGGASATQMNIDIYFCRVKVSNRGKTEAEKVAITIRRVYSRDLNRWRPVERFVPLNLRWSNTWDIVETGKDVPGDPRVLVKDRISPGGECLCDLGFVVDPVRYREFCQRTRFRDLSRKELPFGPVQDVRFVLAFEFIRDLELHRLEPGVYVLEVVADATRIRPVIFWIELEIPGVVQVPAGGPEQNPSIDGFTARCLLKPPADLHPADL